MKHHHIHRIIKHKPRAKEYFIFLLLQQKHSFKAKACCNFCQLSFTHSITFEEQDDQCEKLQVLVTVWKLSSSTVQLDYIVL